MSNIVKAIADYCLKCEGINCICCVFGDYIPRVIEDLEHRGLAPIIRLEDRQNAIRGRRKEEKKLVDCCKS